MRLYWTPVQDVPGAESTGYKLQTETIDLPSEFWNDLKEILGLLAQSRIAAITFNQSGHYVADKLAPLIAQARSLVQSRKGVWNPETLAGVQFGLANALSLDGEQSGKNEPLAESIELYRRVLGEYPRARDPLDWAMTQNNLGLALEKLGERESGTGKLEEAVAAYRAALVERTRERRPLD
jgi:tetratricopeptide (TPR) repeat protein